MNDDLPEGVGSRFGDLSGLPVELLRQIPATRIDETESEILELLRDVFGGAASVDEVLVGLYRKYSIVHDRKKIAGKLYRMVNSKPPLLVGVEKRRGVYRVP